MNRRTFMLAIACALLPGSAEARRRGRRRRSRVVVPPAEPGPRKVPTFRILQTPDQQWVPLRSGPAGIEDVYSRVPPFNSMAR